MKNTKYYEISIQISILEAIKSIFYRIKPIPPLIFREHSL